jgi:uncharacterized membrane protein
MNGHQLMLFGMSYLLLDFVWLSSSTPFLYQPQFMKIQGKPLSLNKGYAVMAYVLLLFTLLSICIPLCTHYSKTHPSIVFAMVGLSIYGIFNMTNAAVLRNYELKTCVVDTLWGICSFATMGLMYNVMKDLDRQS